MTIDQLSEVLKMAPRSIYNAVSAEAFPIQTFKLGKRRLAKTEDVAKHIEELSHA
jgi:hypothetical protein